MSSMYAYVIELVTVSAGGVDFIERRPVCIWLDDNDKSAAAHVKDWMQIEAQDVFDPKWGVLQYLIWYSMVLGLTHGEWVNGDDMVRGWEVQGFRPELGIHVPGWGGCNTLAEAEQRGEQNGWPETRLQPETVLSALEVVRLALDKGSIRVEDPRTETDWTVTIEDEKVIFDPWLVAAGKKKFEMPLGIFLIRRDVWLLRQS